MNSAETDTYRPKHLKPSGPRHLRPATPPADARSPHRRTTLRVVQGLAFGAMAGVVLLPAAADAATVTVRRGDTLRGVAQRNGVSVTELARVNGLSNPDQVRTGATLTLPTSRKVGAPSAARPPAPRPAAAKAAATKPVARRTAATRAASAPSRARTTGAPTQAGPVPRPVTLQPRMPAAKRARMAPIFRAAARRQGVPADLLMTMCWRESDWTQSAVSSVGARGVCQIMPDTAATLSRSRSLQGRTNYLTEADNIEMGAVFLRDLLATHPDTRTALISYNQGPARTQRGEVVPDAAVYAETIQRSRKNFRNL